MVSIKDVAKHAGVAISTVSKVLNNYPNISEETRIRVQASIEELNYVPNAVAAALSSKQSGRIAILINLITQTQAIDEIDMQYLSGAIHEAMELNLDLITVFFSMLKNKSHEEIIRYFKSQNIEGILIFGISKEDKVILELIDSQEFKIVVVDAPLVNPKTSGIWIDQRQAQYDVAKKTLLENTGNKVLYLAGKENGYVSQERLLGIRQLAEDLKLQLKIEKCEFSELKARTITMKKGKNFDIIVCASDLMAIGAMRALIEMDIFRPVCGFDGITLMGYAGKQMNTIKQDFARIAREAVKELFQLVNGGTGRMVVLDYKLVRLNYQDIIC